MKKIVFVPREEAFGCNRLFDANGRVNGWHLGPFSKLANELLEFGCECTTDEEALSADLVVFVDLPETREKALGIVEKYGAPCALLIMESPSGRQHFFSPQNHDLFDRVISYHSGLASLSRKYIHFYLPVEDDVLQPRENRLSFKERKLVSMINTNRQVGWGHSLESRKNSGMHTLPVIGKFFTGWKINISDVVFSARGELYSVRRDIAHAAETVCRNSFGLYGRGWDGGRVSRLNMLKSARKYACYAGFADDKIYAQSQYRFAIAYENCEGNYGYLSEKIFDAFAARTVPVYRGDKSAYDIFPADSFIDGRRFSSSRALLEYIDQIDEMEWNHMLEVGSDFVKNECVDKFSADAFVGTVRRCVMDLLA